MVGLGEMGTDRQQAAAEPLTDLRQPIDAQPHHVVFIADPQLVDPHTYPGRPWPLSALTVAFTDKYLKRSYKTLQHLLNPDTVYFLGDLFDGGREWATVSGGFQASEDRWKKYGQNFWLREYNRFGHIFFDADQVSGGLENQKDKRIIASLPGNHDLGFGRGVQTAVRDRFQAYFGKGDRVDIIGNHTFVALDTVSLSAMDYPDSLEETWRPGVDFLNRVDKITERAIQHELLHRQELEVKHRYAHRVTDAGPYTHALETRDVAQVDTILPTVLLTHVPFFREPGTPCGPLRERHPPTAPGLDIDEPNAIRVAGGYQYQNVLTKELSKRIAEKIGNIGHIFSGDDHDYCDVTHRAYPSAGGGIREITVKSMSWAMGVRKPGFLLASLWNPVDDNGKSLNGKGDPTVQTQLCLLPDQLAIFIRYALCLVLTLVVISVNSIMTARKETRNPQDMSSPVLPIREPTKHRLKGRSRASSASAHAEGAGLLAPRSQNSRARSISPAYGYALPPINTNVGNGIVVNQSSPYDRRDESPDWAEDDKRFVKSKRKRGVVSQTVGYLGHDLLRVAGPALLWYWWLMRSG